MGEFGRSPKVQNTKQFGADGRDHWPYCYTVLMAGGGITPGAIYGSSDRLGAYPATLPSRPTTSPRPCSGHSASTRPPRFKTPWAARCRSRPASRSPGCFPSKRYVEAASRRGRGGDFGSSAMIVRCESAGENAPNQGPVGQRDRGKPARVPWALLVLAGILIAMLPSHVRAQEGADWTGKRVVQKTADFGLRTGKDEKAPLRLPESPRIYLVREANGEWLLLEPSGAGASGWAQSDQVVPVDGAIEYFSDRIKANPRDVFFYAMRGFVRNDKKEWDAALGDLSDAVKLKPAWPGGYKLRGAAWRRKREFDKALDDFDMAIKLDPNDSRAYIGRGTTWWSADQNACAIDDFTEAIRLDPGNDDAYFSRVSRWPIPNNPKGRSTTSVKPFAAIRTSRSIFMSAALPCLKQRTSTRRLPISTW